MNRPDQKPFPPRPIDAALHGATDYTVGLTLLTVFPKIAQIEGTRAEAQIRAAGAVHAGYSTLTDYPLGVVKLIPYKVHLALDAIGALALAATPFVTGQYREGRKGWAPHVGLALFELASLLMTDPSGRGDDHSDPEAAQRLNRFDRDGRAGAGGPAVVADSARPIAP